MTLTAANSLKRQNRAFLRMLVPFIAETGVRSILFSADAVEAKEPVVRALEQLASSSGPARVILVTHDRRLSADLKRAGLPVIVIPVVELSRRGEARAALAIALLNGWIRKSEKVLFISGSRRDRSLDTLFLLRPSQELQIIHSRSFQVFNKRIMPEVLETIIRLALELAHEGREGKPLGTMFVVGDTANVLKYSQQMVLNPFKGYADDKKNILNPDLKESIREFAALDGAFVVRRNGVVVAAGCHIAAPSFRRDLTPGLGARHRAAADITAVTDSIAITISQSNGTVRAFRKGEIFLELSKTT